MATGTVQRVLENNNAIVTFKDCVLCSPEQCRGHEETHRECFITGGPTFVIGTQGLNTDFEIWDEDTWQQETDLPPNMTWEHIHVPSRDHQDAWITAKRQWLEAAWTPNQSPEDRAENADIMCEAEKRMASLEIAIR